MGAVRSQRFVVTLRGFVYQLEKSGWSSFPAASGGFLPLLGVSSSSVQRLLVIEVIHPLFPSVVVRLVRSVFARHVVVPRDDTRGLGCGCNKNPPADKPARQEKTHPREIHG